ARIGVWPSIAPQTGALRKLRLIDATGSLLRAPEILFDSAELGLAAFGHNVENTYLVAALHDAARALPDLTVVTEAATVIEPGTDHVRVTLADGRTVVACLVVGADGRTSSCRAAAGIDVKVREYPQAALTFNM